MAMTDKVQLVLTGRVVEPQGPDRQAAVEGVVHSVAAEGMYYTIPSWDETLLFGPSPYPTYQINAVGPAAGDRCLVLQADTELWVIGWWPHG